MEPQQQMLVVNEQGMPLENAYMVHQDAQHMAGVVTMVPHEAYVQGAPYEQYYVQAHDPAAGQPASEQQPGYAAHVGYDAQGDAAYAQHATGVQAQDEHQQYLQPSDQAVYQQQYDQNGVYADAQQQYAAAPQEHAPDAGYNGHATADGYYRGDEQQQHEAPGVVPQQQEQYQLYETAGQSTTHHDGSHTQPLQQIASLGHKSMAGGLRAAHSTTMIDEREAKGDESPKTAAKSQRDETRVWPTVT
jgi:hypothetical protein